LADYYYTTGKYADYSQALAAVYNESVRLNIPCAYS